MRTEFIPLHSADLRYEHMTQMAAADTYSSTATFMESLSAAAH